MMSIWLKVAKDAVVLVLMHIVLVSFSLYSILSIFREKWRFQRGGTVARGTATRGEESMKLLWVSYGVVTAVFTLAIQLAEAAKGYKLFILFIDYILLTHLFFFNSWFRKWLFRKLKGIRKD